MEQNNFKRMIQLIDEVFDTRHDSGQLQVNEDVINRLRLIHPSTLSEIADNNGPQAWVLLVPTTLELMELFIKDQKNEQELVDQTPTGISYEAIYLCSATVLPECRKQGLAFKLCMLAIDEIRKTHPIKSLFVWPFTPAGECLSEKIAAFSGLSLKKKT